MQEIEFTLKRCSRCKKVKPLDSFPKETKGQLGRGAYCTECRREVCRAYRLTPKGQESYKRRMERYLNKQKEMKAKAAQPQEQSSAV